MGCHLGSRIKHSRFSLFRSAFTVCVQVGGRPNRTSKSSVNVTFLTQNQLAQSDDDKWGKEWIGAPFEESFANYIGFTSTLTSTHSDYDTLLFVFYSFCLFLLHRYYYSLNLFCAHSACQFSMLNIWRTRQWATKTFYRKQQSFPSADVAARNTLWVFVNTDDVFLARVVVTWTHQVAMILLGPSRWTVIPCGHHQQWTTWFDKADDTRCVVIMEISFERVSIVLRDFILSSEHVCWELIAIAVPVVLWIVWKTKVVNSTTLMSVMFSTYYTYKLSSTIEEQIWNIQSWGKAFYLSIYLFIHLFIHELDRKKNVLIKGRADLPL